MLNHNGPCFPRISDGRCIWCGRVSSLGSDAQRKVLNAEITDLASDLERLARRLKDLQSALR